MWLVVALVFSFGFGFVQAVPLGQKAEGKINSDEMVIRLVLHVQRTEHGAQLVVNLEESPQQDSLIRSPPKPLLSVRTDFPTNSLKNKSESIPIPEKNITGIIKVKTLAEIVRKQAPPKLDFKISVRSETSTKTPTTQTTTDPSTTELASTITDDILSEYPKKTVADQGFGVLASRCATYAPGLVSDGAGGCTKPANRLKKKNVYVSKR